MVQRRVYVVPATPVKFVEAAEALLKVPPAPDTTDQAPVPDVGVFAVMATVLPQKLLSVPAFAAAGALLKIMLTSSEDAAHPGLERVQRSVYVVPAFPVNVDVGEDAVAMVPPAPAMIVHVPVPDTGGFPASVAEVPQTV